MKYPDVTGKTPEGKMKYPECPRGTDKECRFVNGGYHCTLAYSPIAYDRNGTPVSGGSNIVRASIWCNRCDSYWTSEQSELEIAQGKLPDWKMLFSDKKSKKFYTK